MRASCVWDLGLTTISIMTAFGLFFFCVVELGPQDKGKELEYVRRALAEAEHVIQLYAKR